MEKKNTPILVTGGTGFIGSYLLRYLVDSGYGSVRALRRAESSLALLGDTADQVEWVEGDICDPESLEEAMEGVEVVIHCAGLASFDPRDRQLLKEVNTVGTGNVVNAALACGVRKLIHVSSVAALGRVEEEGLIDESFKWDRSAINSSYAISKFQGEMEVWRGVQEGLPAVVVNPAVVLGSGDWKSSSSPRIFHVMGKGMPFYATGLHGFVDVRDVARFLLLLLEQEVAGQRYILSAENWRYADLFSAIARKLGKRPPFLPLQRWLGAIAWRLEWVRSRLSHQRAVITRTTIRTGRQDWRYSNEKSRSLGFEYLPLSQTIEETARQWLESQGETPAVLPLV